MQRSNSERDVKHLETERTVRSGLKPGKGRVGRDEAREEQFTHCSDVLVRSWNFFTRAMGSLRRILSREV